MEGLSQRAYAKHRGCAPTAVRKAIDAGRITLEPDGKIDPLKADKQWEASTDPAQTVNMKKHRSNGGRKSKQPDYMESRAKREMYQATLARLKVEEAEGKLISADKVQQSAQAMARRTRDRMLSIPHRLSSELAAMTDPKEIEAAMKKEITEALVELVGDK